MLPSLLMLSVIIWLLPDFGAFPSHNALFWYQQYVLLSSLSNKVNVDWYTCEDKGPNLEEDVRLKKKWY